MSLVAYAASSDEEEVSEDEETPRTVALVKQPMNENIHGHISDDDEDFAPVDVPLQDLKKPSAFTMALPRPKNSDGNINDELEEHVLPTFAKLPMPRSATLESSTSIVEEDDEFLHKKAVPLEKLEKPVAKGPVKITIPSLKDFSDVEKDLASKAKGKHSNVTKMKGSGLLSILPQAKSEQNFAKSSTQKASDALKNQGPPPKPAFIPDTVKNKRPAHNTEGVDGIKAAPKAAAKPPNTATSKASLVTCSDSDDSGDEETASGGDFFSLNDCEQHLPEVSCNEINAMVAKRAAKMAEAATKYLSNAAEKDAVAAAQMEQDEAELRQAQKRYHEQQQSQLDSEAMQALVGSKAKRRRKEDIQVMEISSEQVLPNRDEWMRTALASSTTYQPTGVLVDEEAVAGTRRKHQITYLAHKAKANEAELQAMWSANRQNRRATQSKYGF